MAATSIGRRDRPTKFAKGGTEPSRKHRFESFNQRISKLNIDPIRKVRRQDVDKDDLNSTTSFFGTGLAYWKDLNLSENFAAFVREVEPLCDSLPQILHYNEKIMGILLKYIEKRDAHSLEPLLSLVSHLAHDMGARFEKHFAAAVTQVASLAATHPDVEVIEWSFTCLAWLFKYLSRLLVPDLRPLYDIMAPLLGKEVRKAHITRFAAESLAFLIRKAALGYHRIVGPLDTIVEHAFNDLSLWRRAHTEVLSYQQGIMTLFADAIKGINGGLHSCGTTIYRCMLKYVVKNLSMDAASLGILDGITTNVIHHTDKDAFSPIIDVLLDCIRGLPPPPDSSVVSVYGKLLFTNCAVRKGSRVQNWPAVVECTVILLQFEESHDITEENKSLSPVQESVAVLFQYAPLDIIIPKVRQAMDIMTSREINGNFLLFCNFFCDLGRERFQSLISPYFFKYLASHWEQYENQMLISLPFLLGDDHGSSDRSPKKQAFSCPKTWQQHMTMTFQAARHNDWLIAKCDAYLEVLEILVFEPSSTDAIMENLGKMLSDTLSSSVKFDLRNLFSLGSGFGAILRHSSMPGETRNQIWIELCKASPDTGNMVIYLENLILYCESNDVDVSDGVLQPLIAILIENLTASFGSLRKVSLRLMNLLYKEKHFRESEILLTALIIEDTPFDMPSARTASMHVRRLASQYQVESLDPWISKAIPAFCFGLLTVKLAQLWDDAIAALKIIAEMRIGEETISELALRWLEYRQSDQQTLLSPEKPNKAVSHLNEFQCSNAASLRKKIQRRSQSIRLASEQLQERFGDRHKLCSRLLPNAPSQALRVLTAIPHIAEKRSRCLVPMLFEVAVGDDKAEASDELPNVADEVDNPKSMKLPRRDRKAMLNLFASFSNPRALYRSTEVFTVMKNLLTNGDSEIQKSALKAILTWKPPGVLPYRENLSNLLDDSQFREEMSVFLSIDTEDSTIQVEHRAELMPVLLRILYGKIIAGSGSTSGARGQTTRRKAVFEALSRLPDNDLLEFLLIALGPLHNLVLRDDEIFPTIPLHQMRITVRKQVGLLNMMKDMIETMGVKLVFLVQPMVNAILYCITQTPQSNPVDVENGRQDPIDGQQESLRKTIRHVGLQCLTLLFKICPPADMQSYLPMLFSKVLNPRLDKFPVETAQSVSGMLQLFAVWAFRPDMACYLSEYNSSLLAIIIDCLEVPSAKDEVRLFILDDILRQLISLATSPDTDQDIHAQSIQSVVLAPNTTHILERTGTLLRKSPSKNVLESAIHLISMTVPIVDGSSQVGSLLDISAFLLDQPSQRVSPKAKGDLLQIVQHFVPLISLQRTEALHQRLFVTISSLFGYFKDRSNRVKLSQVLGVLAQKDEELNEVAELCIDLNAFSASRMDEPDFEKRLKAFNKINETTFKSLTPKQWRPILYNMLYYVKDTEELAIRSNASFALRRFVERNHFEGTKDTVTCSELLKQVVVPAIRAGASERSELVRTEYLSIMAQIVRHNSEWPEVCDMTRLLVEEDEEASFFGNVLHIQQHRRLRALRRLATEAGSGRLRSTNVAHFLVPLLEHFIFDRGDDEGAHNLASEAVTTIGALAEWMEWPQLRAMFRRFSSYIQSKPELEKGIIKLMGVIIDAIGRAAVSKEQFQNMDSEISSDITEAAQIDPKLAQSTLSITMPGPEKFAEDLTKNLLPSLLTYLHNKDESTVSLRVPVAVSVVKLLKLLPATLLAERLPPVLTDVCHILRSRAQESRDLTRKTLVDICTLVGPSYFGFVLKELRSSLARGYQLHVLSFTVHAILVATATIFKPGDLDYCLSQVVAIIMDDIFGVTGQEKDAEEYISKMKEVKSSKSFDSMELIAKTATIGHLSHLVRPLQTLLEEKLDLKMVKKIDELLRRISVGLLRNEAIESRETLVFCYEIIQDVYKANNVSKDKLSKEDYRVKRYLVASKGKARSTLTYSYKLFRFSLDVLRAVLHKYDSLQTPSNLSGFMPAIGDALLQAQEEVQISALRLLATTIKVPLKEIDENAPTYITEAVRMIKNTVPTNSELAQAALKLISTALRERKDVRVKEQDLAYLLKRLMPDLEEPDRQGNTFNFLKAVLTRKVIIPEVYEVMDTIATMMVTSQSQGARDLARGLYFQFVLNYPQGKDRLSKQLSFLVKNLDYKHVEGRQSVMEAVHLLLSKIGDNLVQELAGTFFVPLIMVTINDDSVDCRKMAGALLKELFERADEERTNKILVLLRTWLVQDEQPLLVRTAMQIYSMYLDVPGKQAEKEVAQLQTRVSQLLKSRVEETSIAEWELVYSTLQMVMKLCQIFPSNMFRTTSLPIWECVRQCLYFPHAWVKFSASKLLGIYFADFAKTNAEKANPSLPLRGSGGLQLGEEEMIQITKASLASLRVPGVGEELANQCVRNLLFLGRFMGTNRVIWGKGRQHLIVGQDDDDQENESVEEDDSNMILVSRQNKSALEHIFERLSAILRREPLTTRAPSLIPKIAALQLIAALCNHLSVEVLSESMETILLPLHNLTDPSIAAPYSPDEAYRTAYKALVSTSQEIMALLQKKLGTTEYVTQLSKVRGGVKERREGRRVKRRLEAVAEPEKMEREKKRKGEKKREKRKERSGDYRGRRLGY